MFPPRDVAQWIGSGVIPGLTYHNPPTVNGNVFYGTEKAPAPPHVPDDAVYVMGGPGGSPARVMSLRYEVRYPMVHIRTRARTADKAETWARAIQDLFQMGMPTGYLDAQALQSDPTPADSPSQHIRYTMTYQLIYDRDGTP